MVLAVVVLVVGLFVALITVLVVVGIVSASKDAQRRRQGMAQVSSANGWQYLPREPSLEHRWHGEPFHSGGRTTGVIIGNHRDRPFVAFEYRYTTSNGENHTVHYFTVWCLQLRAMAPEFSVGQEGVFGGKVATAFGMNRVKIGNDAFDSQFKIKCHDGAFAQHVLQPPLLEMLAWTGPWAWRLTGDSMLSWTRGRLEPAMIVPRLELMSDVLDRIPGY